MERNSIELDNITRTAAWVWLVYLLALGCMDWFLYADDPGSIVRQYYLVNGAIALLFLGCAYWPWLQRKLQAYYVPLMLFIIAGLPIIANRLLIPPLPPGPLSNVEGLALRLLPILFIGLVMVAWQYPWSGVVLYAIGTAALDLMLLQLKPPSEHPLDPMIFVLLIRFVSFLVVGYFISRLVGRLNDQHNELKLANARLVQYAGTVEQLTISRERNRMARELHDTLAHTLSGLSVQLETTQAYWDVEPETARELLTGSLNATRSGLDETRRALKALRASPLDDLGLLLALQKLAKSAAERGQFALSLSLPDQIPSLSPDVEQCIYRIAQEAIENAAQHANANTLEIQLTVSEEEINLSIEDDGLGFDVEKVKENGHYGLSGMRERAQVAGGELNISSKPDKGTRIELQLRRKL